MTSRIQALKTTRFRDVQWGAADKPIAIVDGKLYRVASLDSRLEGEVADVVGVNEKSFPRLCKSLRVKSLQLYEMRVADLEPVVQIEGLRELAIRWNTKLTSIAPLRGSSALETLVLEDTPKVRDLSPLANLTKLSSFEFSGGIWNKNKAISLEAVAALPALNELVLLNLAVKSGGLRPLAQCRSLRRLELSNQFPTADYAYLSVHLPTTECDYFSPWVRLTQPIGGKDTLVVGQRKPLLRSSEDRERIAKYESEFTALQQEFKADARGRKP